MLRCIHLCVGIIIIFRSHAAESNPKTESEDNNDGIHLTESNLCNYTFTRSRERHLQELQSFYIARLVSSTLISRKINVFADLIRQIYHAVNLQYSCDMVSYSPVITYLCRSMYFHSWTPSSQSWRIQVYEAFSINFTIYRAYVPFTDACSPHGIHIYESHLVSNSNIIDTFCGKVYHESVFTIRNAGLLRIKFDTKKLIFPVTLRAGYSSISQGVAYKSRKICMQDSLLTNVPPGFMLLLNSRLHYFWYASNNVFMGECSEGELHRFKFFGSMVYTRRYHANMAYFVFDIQDFQCVSDTAMISAYAGLVPVYLVKWHAAPNRRLVCNDTTLRDAIQIDFHMHATVILDVSLNHKVELKMNYSVKSTKLYSYDKSYWGYKPSYYSHSNHDITGTDLSFINRWKSSFMKVDVIHAKTFTIKDFSTKGETTTIHMDFMNRLVSKSNFSRRLTTRKSRFEMQFNAAAEEKGNYLFFSLY